MLEKEGTENPGERKDISTGERKNILTGERKDISLKKIILYLALFLIPLGITFMISNFVAIQIYEDLQVSPYIVVNILMIFFTLIIFGLIIPYIRDRENVQGVRLALFAFLIVASFMTLPAIVSGIYELVPIQMIFLANYILLTFVFSPEVLGVGKNLADYFKHHKQFLIILIYVSIVFFYVAGFAGLHNSIYLNSESIKSESEESGMSINTPPPYNLPDNEMTGYPTFLYYSLVTFATLGYGDITPVSPAARLVTVIEIFIGLFINVVFIAILLMYITTAEQQSITQEEKTIIAAESKIMSETKRIENVERANPEFYSANSKNRKSKIRNYKKK